jgi:hypothetical protein
MLTSAFINTIMRIVGVLMRTFVLALALIILLAVIIVGVGLLLVWIFWPLLAMASFLFGVYLILK